MKTTSKNKQKWRRPQKKIKNEDDLRKKWRQPQSKKNENEEDLTRQKIKTT